MAKLARHYQCSPTEFRQRFTDNEIVELLALEQIEPLPDQWLMWRWLMAALTNKKPNNFNFTKRAKPQTAEDTKTIFRMMARRSRLLKERNHKKKWQK